MESRTIRIGTRESELALWQAKTVQAQLERQGYSTVLMPITSTGDQVQDKPLYAMGITGIFTKTLDIAMLSGQCDIAVHSMKDVPTALPEGIIQAAVLERANPHDILALHPDNPDTEFLNDLGTIATGSVRRRAQWLHRYENHEVVGLRGNVNTRMKKLEESDWNGAIFARAGLERIDLMPKHHMDLDWMVPAPAQGAMVVMALEEDKFCRSACAKINHRPSQIRTHIEKEFLKTLEGGCTAPIGALAEIVGNRIQFKGALFSLDGKTKIEIARDCTIEDFEGFGKRCAAEVLERGGQEVMVALRQEL